MELPQHKKDGFMRVATRVVAFRHNVLVFMLWLRRLGFLLTYTDYHAYFLAQRAVGVCDKHTLHSMLVALWVKREEDMALFNEAFAYFWTEHQGHMEALKALTSKVHAAAANEKQASSRFQSLIKRSQSSRVKQAPDWSIQRAWTMSIAEKFSHVDWHPVDLAESMELTAWQKIVQRKQQLLKKTPYASEQRGKTPHWQRMLKEAVKRPDAWVWKTHGKKRQKREVVWLIDASGSMQHHLRAYMLAIKYLQKAGVKSKVFLFSSLLERVDERVLKKDVDVFLQYVHDRFTLVGSGTRFSECLQAFNRRWVRKIGSSQADCVLITDGLDANYQGYCKQELFRLRSAFHRLVWANPLLGPSYQATAQAAVYLLRVCHAKVPASNYQQLWRLVVSSHDQTG